MTKLCYKKKKTMCLLVILIDVLTLNYIILREQLRNDVICGGRSKIFDKMLFRKQPQKSIKKLEHPC